MNTKQTAADFIRENIASGERGTIEVAAQLAELNEKAERIARALENVSEWCNANWRLRK